MGQSSPPTGKTILIVEDEALIRFDLIDFFENAGFSVVEAESADEAIAILDRDISIQVVLTDVQMPGSMDGLRLAHHIRNRFPPTLLVVTSGVLHPGKAEMPTNSFFVAKPINRRQVLDRIEQMLG
jgi:CheY-like chemotaxis protein